MKQKLKNPPMHIQTESFELVKQSRDKILGRTLSCVQFQKYFSFVAKQRLLSVASTKHLHTPRRLLPAFNSHSRLFSAAKPSKAKARVKKSFGKMAMTGSNIRGLSSKCADSATPRVSSASLAIERANVPDKVDTVRKGLPRIVRDVVRHKQLVPLSAVNLEVDNEECVCNKVL
eukprot:TRINITY_DN4867_c0_g1_i1.p1 TRINITY_DN4867_c0_g1~~TRINITY_DN4867_c0_g1_i1.p1  ORF type:complete len:174 (-),score=8.59 TRINITY_DN4867_c0_g1_i1:122-643(-)